MERKEPLRLTNKDIRLAFEHLCEYFDEKYGVWYDDSDVSLRDFTAWVQEYIVESTNNTLKEMSNKSK